jgi:hypothetical protein
VIYIVVAHHKEAERVIQNLNLKKLSISGAKDIFGNTNYRLIVSGSGELSAAVATSILGAEINTLASNVFVNLGVAASTDPSDVGSIFHIHSLHSQSFGRSFYPDMIVNLGIPQRGLESWNRPFLRSETTISGNHTLIDMEAAGFYDAARCFVAPSRICVIKLVTDSGGGSLPELKRSIIQALSRSAHLFLDPIERLRCWIESRPSIEHLTPLLHSIRDQLALSETQWHDLLFRVRALSDRDDDRGLKILFERYAAGTAHTREDKRTNFRALLNELSVPLV